MANFELSDPRNFGRIKHLQSDGKNRLYVVDNNGFLYALSIDNFKEIWKIKLEYEQVANFEVSPNGTTLAITYNYIKTATKKLEIRNCKNGHISLHLKQTPDCYEAYYLADVVDNTTLYPYKMVYNPQGTQLAIWYQNHGFDENKCIAKEEEKLIIIDPITGDILASKNKIPNDFSYRKCEGNYPFVFSKEGKHLMIANCRGELNVYDAHSLKLIRQKSFETAIQHIEQTVLKTKVSKSSQLAFISLSLQPNGSLISNIGKKGRFFSISADMEQLNYIGQFHKNTATTCTFSPKGAMFMLNGHQVNLWDLNDPQALLCTETPHAYAAKTACFHPKKRALIIGSKRSLKIVAPCPVTTVHIADTFTATGHYVQAETSFSVVGQGNIEWAYDDLIIYHKYAKNKILSTHSLGFSHLFNSRQNIPDASQLRIKTDMPGIYTIFGGTKKRWNRQQVLEHLDNWD